MLPLRGGTAAAYRGWHSAVVPVCAVQLPGRANRYAEPCIEGCAELVRAVPAALVPLRDLPAAFFGHSLGVIVAFEVSRAPRRETYGTPGSRMDRVLSGSVRARPRASSCATLAQLPGALETAASRSSPDPAVRRTGLSKNVGVRGVCWRAAATTTHHPSRRETGCG